MIPIGIKIVEDYTDNLLHRLQEIGKQEVLVGVTEADGVHEPSGLSYVDLLKIHSAGVPSLGIPSRDIATLTLLTVTNEEHKKFKDNITKYLEGIDKKSGKVTAEFVAKEWALSVWKRSYNMFGNTTYLESNSERVIESKGGRDSPLIDTGELQHAWSATVNGIKVRG